MHTERDIKAANFLLSVGTTLLASGAHCGRITRNIERIAKTWGYRADPAISFSGILLTIVPQDRPNEQIQRYQSCPHHGARFDTITEVSLLSWQIVEKQLPIDAAEAAYQQASSTRPHPRWQVLLGIGLACASLCLLAGGDLRAAMFAFVAAIAGMSVRLLLMDQRFHPMISIIAAAFTTTMLAGVDRFISQSLHVDAAIATSVLYLIPGIQLVNCTIDLIEGHIQTALARAIFGCFILLSIAVGMSLALLILHTELF